MFIVDSDDDVSDFEDAGIEIIARRFRRFFKKQSSGEREGDNCFF